MMEYLDECVEQQLSNKDAANREQYQLLRDCVSGQYYPNTGILVHKRFTNLPLQLMTALHRNLEEDISWAKQQASEDAESDSGAEDSLKAVASATELNSQQNSASHSDKVNPIKNAANSNGKSSSSSNNGGGTSAAANSSFDTGEPIVTRQRSLSTSSTDSSRQQHFFGNAYYTILLSECSISDAARQSPAARAIDEKHGCANVLHDTNLVMFEYFEDEVYLQHAVAAILFRPPKNCCGTDLVAMVIPISRIKNCANGISSFE